MTTYGDRPGEEAEDTTSGGTGWRASASGTPPGYGADYEPRRLYRSTTDRVFAGVCGGLAEHFGWDPSATRVGYAVLTIFTGIFPMLLLYIVMAIVVPEARGTGRLGDRVAAEPGDLPRRRASSGSGALVVGVLLIVGGGIALLNRYFFINWSDLGPLVAIAIGVVVIALGLSRRT
jgi:phage shock protein PspC (stress-responsive transcriptional regulator)